jgi:hypothetical protein
MLTATGYELYRDGKLVQDSNNTSYYDKDIESGKTYTYYVIAKRGSFTSLPCESVKITTPGDDDPFADAHDWAKENLAKADEAGIIPDSFKAAGWRTSTTRLTVVDAIVEMLEGAGISRDAYAAAKGWNLNENPFPDVTGNKNLTFLQKAGVVSGTKGADGINYYRPNGTHTRREAAVIVGNIAEKFFGVANVRGSNPFTDVPNSHWSAPYLGYAADNNIVEGNLRADGTRTFNPSGRLTNEATIVLMLNAFNHFKSK